jgi:hypothetical protein
MGVDDVKNWGHVFMHEIVVQVTENTPLHHGPYKPERPWTDYLTPSLLERGFKLFANHPGLI